MNDFLLLHTLSNIWNLGGQHIYQIATGQNNQTPIR
jgi:hypothetical protein